MIKHTFTRGFRICLHQKDLNLALQNAHELGISLPAKVTAAQLFNAVETRGDQDLDDSAMVQALEMLASHEISGAQNSILLSNKILFCDVE